MLESFLIVLAFAFVCFMAGYGITGLLFRWLFGIRITINDQNGQPQKYRLKNGILRRLK